MQHKQKFTNVTLVTPSGEEEKDILQEGGKNEEIMKRKENITDEWKISDGNKNDICQGLKEVRKHG